MGNSLIHIENLVVGYNTKEILKEISLDLRAGELTSLLGPNGSGKSTLIRSISGVQKVLQGQVEIKGQSIDTYHQRELAKQLSLVLTDNQAPGNLTVYALVALGRFPFTSWLGSLSKSDKEVIEWALESTGMLGFANRHVGELSDGERQKIMIARALAQQTDIIILDEPTAHLDTPNRLEIFHLLKELVSISGRAILVSTHDIDTALHYADQLWLVHDQKIKNGVPEDLVLNGALEKAFGQKDLTFDYQTGQFKKNLAHNKKEVSVEGESEIAFWISNALQRNGFIISNNSNTHIQIEGTRQNAVFRFAGEEHTYKTIEQILIQLKNGEN